MIAAVVELVKPVEELVYQLSRGDKCSVSCQEGLLVHQV